jgi:intracellular sulfur oxidation DsrE/DsrF family protein
MRARISYLETLAIKEVYMRTGQRWSGIIVAAVGLIAFAVPAVEASHLKENPRKHKIVYQLDDAGADKAKFVLGNVRNHISGVGGFQNIEALELVVFGPALRMFVTKTMDPDVARLLELLQTQGMTFGACGNTMKNYTIVLEQLPDGTRPLPQGGVVRIMELQDAGYVYIRP